MTFLFCLKSFRDLTIYIWATQVTKINPIADSKMPPESTRQLSEQLARYLGLENGQ